MSLQTTSYVAYTCLGTAMLAIQNHGWKAANKVVRPRYTGKSLMRKIIADPSSGVSAFVRQRIGDEAADTLDEHQQQDPVDEEHIFEGPPSDVIPQPGNITGRGIYTFACLPGGNRNVAIPAMRAGFAMKPGGLKKPTRPTKKYAKMTREQLQFLQWCFDRGVKNKSDKIGPAQAQQLMPLLGTSEGEKRFPGEAYWTASTALDPFTGMPKPKFRPCELLDHWSFRPWFSQQKAQFDKKVSAQAKLAENASALSLDVNSDDEDVMED